MRVEKVFITPLVKEDTYGLEVDVSGFVRVDGLSKIKRSIDSTDYSVGIFRFDALKIKAKNDLGTFNENDSRSIFPYVRDKAKVRVLAQDIDPDTFVVTSAIQFEGLINDEATRQNITNDQITFKALSKNSVFRTTKVPAGTVTGGTGVKQAIFSILSQNSITNVLTVDINNIEPDFEFTIDVGSGLDNLSVEKAINSLMQSSNSVILLRDDTIYVQSRQESDEEKVLVLNGRGEITNNANILSVSSYNSGKHRQINSVILNEVLTVSDEDYVTEYGLRQTEFSFPYVTNLQTLLTIGTRIVDEFKFPKIELKLRIPTVVLGDFDLLDIVRVNAPWLRKPCADKFLPILGATKLGDSEAPLPEIFGSIQILENVKFKIIAIADDAKNFIAAIKVRQFGKTTNDGVFDTTTFAYLGEALLGTAILGKG